MNKPKVFITRAIPDDGLDLVKNECVVEVWPLEIPLTHDELLEKISGIDGLLCLLTDPIDAEIMDAAGKQLKVISNYAVGYNNIDVSAATERGILVCNTPGVLTETTADLAFALLMVAARRLGEGIEYVKQGKWKTWGPKLFLGQDIHNATLGIIGMGEIGTGMAKRAKGFNMNIIYYDHKHRAEKGEAVGARMCDSIEELLKEADFISLHVPLSNETYKLINAKAFELMKNSAVLINTSRGPVVDSRALFEALKNNEIAYAALDVTDPEPIPPNHKLLSVSNCIIVPHVGSASVKTRAKMAVMAAENLMAGLKGEVPKNLINPEVLNK